MTAHDHQTLHTMVSQSDTKDKDLIRSTSRRAVSSSISPLNHDRHQTIHSHHVTIPLDNFLHIRHLRTPNLSPNPNQQNLLRIPILHLPNPTKSPSFHGTLVALAL